MILKFNKINLTVRFIWISVRMPFQLALSKVTLSMYNQLPTMEQNKMKAAVDSSARRSRIMNEVYTHRNNGLS